MINNLNILDIFNEVDLSNYDHLIFETNNECVFYIYVARLQKDGFWEILKFDKSEMYEKCRSSKDESLEVDEYTIKFNKYITFKYENKKVLDFYCEITRLLKIRTNFNNYNRYILNNSGATKVGSVDDFFEVLNILNIQFTPLEICNSEKYLVTYTSIEGKVLSLNVFNKEIYFSDSDNIVKLISNDIFILLQYWREVLKRFETLIE